MMSPQRGLILPGFDSSCVDFDSSVGKTQQMKKGTRVNQWSAPKKVA